VKREDLKHPLSKAIAPLILGLCRYPADCRILEAVDGSDVAITVIPHRADFKIVCGKSGRQIKAIKYLAARAGQLGGYDAQILLEEGLVGSPEPAREFQQDPQFDVDGLLEQIRRATSLVFDREMPLSFERQCDKIKVYIDADPDDPEEVPSVMALADVFYPAAFKAGMICEIRVRKRAPEPAR